MAKRVISIYASARELEYMAKWAKEKSGYIRIDWEDMAVWHKLMMKDMPYGDTETVPYLEED